MDKCVVVSVDTGVNSNTEDMLVVLGEDAWAYDIAPRSSLALLDQNRRDNACCASLHSDGTGLIENVLYVALATEILYYYLYKIDSR